MKKKTFKRSQVSLAKFLREVKWLKTKKNRYQFSKQESGCERAREYPVLERFRGLKKMKKKDTDNRKKKRFLKGNWVRLIGREDRDETLIKTNDNVLEKMDKNMRKYDKEDP